MCAWLRHALALIVVGLGVGCGSEPVDTAPVDSAPQAELGEAGSVNDPTGFDDGDQDQGATGTPAESESNPSESNSDNPAAEATKTPAGTVFFEDDKDEEDE